MHAVSLVMGSVAAHAWAKSIIADAQRLVSLFKSSQVQQRCYGVKPRSSAWLASSNQTRFTSVHMCLTSVQAMQAPHAAHYA
mmetsp:Transcript_33754/g.74766  ORF Transcript_33754/g.74766 Transcript_33754/m.74766 type:complete len:82 (-) Transcript_33754:1103-1348(-)